MKKISSLLHWVFGVSGLIFFRVGPATRSTPAPPHPDTVHTQRLLRHYMLCIRVSVLRAGGGGSGGGAGVVGKGVVGHPNKKKEAQKIISPGGGWRCTLDLNFSKIKNEKNLIAVALGFWGVRTDFFFKVGLSPVPPLLHPIQTRCTHSICCATECNAYACLCCALEAWGAEGGAWGVSKGAVGRPNRKTRPKKS